MIIQRLITCFTAHTQRKTKIKEIRYKHKEEINCNMEKWHHRCNECQRNFQKEKLLINSNKVIKHGSRFSRKRSLGLVLYSRDGRLTTNILDLTYFFRLSYVYIILIIYAMILNGISKKKLMHSLLS